VNPDGKRDGQTPGRNHGAPPSGSGGPGGPGGRGGGRG
jgi:hypothetical protein